MIDVILCAAIVLLGLGVLIFIRYVERVHKKQAAQISLLSEALIERYERTPDG